MDSAAETLLHRKRKYINIALSAYFGLLYAALFSMLLGFFFWYHGLALGGIAKVGQIQHNLLKVSLFP